MKTLLLFTWMPSFLASRQSLEGDESQHTGICLPIGMCHSLRSGDINKKKKKKRNRIEGWMLMERTKRQRLDRTK